MTVASEAQNFVVAGAGRMGRGIALSFAWAGRTVTLVDSEPRTAQQFSALAEDTAAAITTEIEQLQGAGAIDSGEAHDISNRVRICSRADSAAILAKADVVFEAVLERLDVKRSTYAWLSKDCSPQAILSSTTSTMLADTLAGFVTHPERYSNAHWLNPAYLMPLVEVSPATATSAETVDRLRGLLEAIGKVPVVCAASPGYILSRIQALVLNEAARLVAEGVASAEDIDRAIRTGFGPRYTVFGPLEFIDWGGGDILYYASSYLAEALDRERFAPPDIVRENMEAGRNGIREGQGFYDWSKVDPPAYNRERMAQFTQLLGQLRLLPAAVARAHAPEPGRAGDSQR